MALTKCAINFSAFFCRPFAEEQRKVTKLKSFFEELQDATAVSPIQLLDIFATFSNGIITNKSQEVDQTK